MSSKYENYLMDLGRILLKNALKSKKRTVDTGDRFDDGMTFAYYDVITIMLSEAEAFNIEPAELGLGGVNPDRDILATAAPGEEKGGTREA